MAQPRQTQKTTGQAADRSRQTTGRTAPVERTFPEITTPVALAIFGVVTLIFFWSFISGGAFLWEDFVEFTYPHHAFAARSFAEGVMPQWNPFSMNGMPFSADLQVGLYYPANIMMFLLSGGDLSPVLAQIVVVVHYFIAMMGMWFLARGLGINSWGSLTSGLAYGLTGMLVAHMIHANMVEHLAWFPLAVHLFRRGMAERSLRHALGAGLVLGVSFLAGHPQSTLYIVFFLAILAVWQFVRDLRSGDDAARSGVGISVLCAAVPVIVGVGIFAIQLLPAQELAGLSERVEISYEKSLEGSLGTGQLLTLVAPKYFGVTSAADQAGTVQPTNPFWYQKDPTGAQEGGYTNYWETVIYTGVTVLLLAIVGLASRRLGSFGWLLGALALVGLLYALGDRFFLHPVLSKLPLFGSFRIPTRLAIYLSLGGAVLAGAGVDALLRGLDRDRLGRVALMAGGALALVALLVVGGAMNGFMNPPEQLASVVKSSGTAPLLLALATAALAWFALRGVMPGVAAGAGFALLVVIDLAVFGMKQNQSPVNPKRDVYQANDEKFVALKPHFPDSIFRVKMRDYKRGGGSLMQRNQGPYSGIMLFDGYNPLLLARRNPPMQDQEKMLDLLNIRYDMKVDSATGRGGLVTRTTNYPHARMLYNVQVFPDDSAMKRAVAGGTIDFGTTVALERQPSPAVSGGSGTARITRYDAAEIVTDVTTDKPGVLLLSEIWYPAWQVEIDGAPAELLRANWSMRAVAVPAGHHTVTMRYASSAGSTGTLITVIASVIGLGGWGFLTLRSRRKSVAESPA